MSRNVLRIDSSAKVLDAVRLMNQRGVTGAVVFQGKQVVGMLTERALLRRFAPMNKKPDEVGVIDVMAPLLRIDVKASIREAAKKISSNRVTRLGVFEDGKFVGWLTINDLAREHTRKTLLDTLLLRGESEVDEILCPACRNGPLVKVVRNDGRILRWECPKCGYVE